MGASWSGLMKTGVPLWDAPPSFWLWLKATQTNNYSVILDAPLTKTNWLAARWLFKFSGFQQRYAKLTFDLLKAVLAKG